MFAKHLGRFFAPCAVAVVAVYWATPPIACAGEEEESSAAKSTAGQDDGGLVVGPGPVPMDVFHPDNRPDENGNRPPQPPPRYGGRIIVHLESMPENINRAIENSAVTRYFQDEIGHTILHQNWETWEYEPKLVTHWDTEDMAVLTPEAEAKYAGKATDVKVKIPFERDEEGNPEGATHRDAKVLYGQVVEQEGSYMVTPISKGAMLTEPVRVPKEDVAQLERGSVITFYVRPDVKWQPADGIEGHTVDARDLLFSWQIYQNPEVDCDQVRFAFNKVTRGEASDDMTVRFFYETQYFGILSSIGTDMAVLPSHLYDLRDPDNPNHKPEATISEQAKHINENDHNQMWVGCGPYQITEYNQNYIEATRFKDYYDQENAGYPDAIRWRLIDDDNAAYQALLEGELDFFYRVKSADYFGEATEKPEFTDNFYKGYYYLGTYGFNVWNMYRPQLKDPAVRKAIAHVFDFEDYKRTNYKGLVNQVTGPFPYNSLAYNHEIKPYPYDPETAIEILEDAGWYDRNGDETVDKDGVELVIDFMMPSGNDASTNFGLKLQESLAEVGIKLNITELEWATMGDRLQDREFDSSNLAWTSGLESDPEQVWHSKWGKPKVRSSNYAGLQDAEADRLIEAGQRELDKQKRQGIWHQLHARLYELQPILFMYNVPRKFAMSKRIRGHQSFAIRPGYSVRNWYFTEDEPGTRATLAER